MKKRLLSVLILTFIPFTAVFAVKVTSLYQTNVAVTSQSESARLAALKQGLLAVLARASGNLQMMNHPSVNAALANAEDFVQTYHYSPVTNGYALTLQYNKAAINLLLKSAGASVWADDRPLVLVWAAAFNPHATTTILSRQTDNELMRAMQRASEQIGLPLVFPLMDMADIAQVAPHDVKTFSISPLSEASKRYLADAMLVGSVREQDKQIQSQWRLIVGNKQWEWVFKEDSIALIADRLVMQIAQVLATNDKVVPHTTATAHQHFAAKTTIKEFDEKPIDGFSF